MARVTVEDCLDKVENRFLLVMLASKRVKQLYKGAKPLIDPKKQPPGGHLPAGDRGGEGQLRGRQETARPLTATQGEIAMMRGFTLFLSCLCTSTPVPSGDR